MVNGKYQFEIGLEALIRSLDEFRRGNITNNKTHRKRLKQNLRKLSERWDQRFPDFPKIRFPCSSFLGVCRAAARDTLLKKIIIRLLEAERLEQKNKTIVNPACVFGRHARDLASHMRSCKLIGTDINPKFNRLYEHLLIGGSPSNYEFKQDNIFNPQLHEKPTVVVFFGACGSVSDGAIDYAIESNALYLIFRTCCHDNIGGNTAIVRRFTVLNWDFRIKNFVYYRKREKGTGEYFSDKYSKHQYPRSKAARALSDSDEFIEVSSNSVESDVCRSIIDLDRYLYLAEKEYQVLFKGDLFVAERY